MNTNQNAWGDQTPQQQEQEQETKVFPAGIRFFDRHPNAPDFVLASMVITMKDLSDFLAANPNVMTEYDGKKQLKIQVLRSREGKIYSVVDTYKPQQKAQAQQQHGWGQQAAAPGGWGQQAAQQQTQPQQKIKDDQLPF